MNQGYYFLHSSETCLVGVKTQVGKKFEYISKVSNDVIFAQTRKKSQKPDQLYHIIEKMVPGGRKVELFARNHCIRKGWLSLGNQLGEYFDWDHDEVSCDTCEQVIKVGQQRRYKSRFQKDKDLCESCAKKNGEKEEDFFVLENVVNEMVFHEWYQCTYLGRLNWRFYGGNRLR
jgi:mRNA (2'-O-methyladenosine-N6-)-methyltransferase